MCGVFICWYQMPANHTAVYMHVTLHTAFYFFKSGIYYLAFCHRIDVYFARTKLCVNSDTKHTCDTQQKGARLVEAEKYFPRQI